MKQGVRSLKSNFRPVAFFDELAHNLSAHGVKIVIYVGNDDSVAPHFSSESMSTPTQTCLFVLLA